MSMVGLTRVASVAEAPFHLEFVSSFFINSESDHGEESGCGGANREARECKPNKQNRNPGVETAEARRRNFPSPEKKSAADAWHLADRGHSATGASGSLQ